MFVIPYYNYLFIYRGSVRLDFLYLFIYLCKQTDHTKQMLGRSLCSKQEKFRKPPWVSPVPSEGTYCTFIKKEGGPDSCFG